jgi:outer membrane protein OmpA-like peptidoglycan-associated protein
MRKALALVAGGVVLLVGAYALLGTLVAPRLIRSALIQRAAQAGLDLRIGAIHALPFRLALRANDVQLATRDGKRVAQAGRATVDLAAASLWQRTWILDRVALEGPALYALPAAPGGSSAPPPIVVREWTVADGALALPGLPRLEHVQIDGHGNAYSASAALASGGSAHTEGRLALAPLEASGELQLAHAALPGLWRELPPGELGGSLKYRYAGGKLTLSAAGVEGTLRSGGKAHVSGELTLPPVQGRLALDAQDLPLALGRRWLPAIHGMSGAVQARGTLQLGANARYEGSATIRDARLDGPQGELLGWRSLETAHLRLDLAPFGAHADEVVAQAPRASVVIGPKGELNITRAFTSGDNHWPEGGAHAAISVDRLTIENGQLDFTDRSLQAPFSTTVRDLSGAVTGLSTAADAPAQIALTGRVGRYGEARVRGTLEPVAPATRTNVQLQLRNLALADFTPYAEKFAGYRVESGTLSATLRYRVREGRLVGTNQLEFDRLKLGEKVESAGALDLPVELAVALLTDAQGRINLAIPVSGDLRDPQFDLGGLMAKALRNTLTRVVSAPFRALASIVGRGEGQELKDLRFAPGSAELEPPEEEKLAQVAQALAERPRVALAIRPGYDPQADLQALKRAALLHELAQRAGYSAAAAAGSSAALDARDPKIRGAAQRLYLARGGHVWDLVKLKPRDLLAALVEKTQVAPDAVQALAEQRARAVRDALGRSGVDAARIDAASPTAVQAQPDGVSTTLALQSRLSSAR